MRRVQLEIVLGTLLVLLSVTIVVIMGIREPKRLTDYAEQQRGRQIEYGAGVFTTYCTGCHATQAQGITGRAPSLRDEFFFTQRLAEVGWSGSLEDYIVAVVTTGRQVSTRPTLYAGFGKPAMPTFSDKFGGPLRDDQIRAVAAFIVNFQPYALGQLPTPVPLVPLVDESTPEGRGQAVFLQNVCTACHTITGLSSGTIGPVLDGLVTRAATRVSGLTAEEYIRQSILTPSAYVVDGFPDNTMPQNFGTVLSADQLNDLIAFLLTLK